MASATAGYVWVGSIEFRGGESSSIGERFASGPASHQSASNMESKHTAAMSCETNYASPMGLAVASLMRLPNAFGTLLRCDRPESTPELTEVAQVRMRVLIATAAAIAVAAGFASLQTEPPATRIVATEPSTPRLVEIGGTIIPYEPGSGVAVIEHGSEPDTGPIGALVRTP
jgi:hypothetical protein